MKKSNLISKLVAAVILGAFHSSIGYTATVNIGAVANSTTTGQFLSISGTTVTTGLIRVGFFSGKSFADIQTVISGWSGSTTALDAYNSLNSLFTAVGTVVNPPSTGGTLGGSTTGLYSTAGSGWNFSSSGNVSGTANYVDLALAPQNTQIYIWAFNNSDFSFSSASAPTQWALVTDRNATGGTWTVPGSGALSAVLNSVTTQNDILLGLDNGNNVNMVAVIPEPSTFSLLAVGLLCANTLRKNRKLFPSQLNKESKT